MRHACTADTPFVHLIHSLGASTPPSHRQLAWRRSIPPLQHKAGCELNISVREHDCFSPRCAWGTWWSKRINSVLQLCTLMPAHPTGYHASECSALTWQEEQGGGQVGGRRVCVSVSDIYLSRRSCSTRWGGAVPPLPTTRVKGAVTVMLHRQCARGTRAAHPCARAAHLRTHAAPLRTRVTHMRTHPVHACGHASGMHHAALQHTCIHSQTYAAYVCTCTVAHANMYCNHVPGDEELLRSLGQRCCPPVNNSSEMGRLKPRCTDSLRGGEGSGGGGATALYGIMQMLRCATVRATALCRSAHLTDLTESNSQARLSRWRQCRSAFALARHSEHSDKTTSAAAQQVVRARRVQIYAARPC